MMEIIEELSLEEQIKVFVRRLGIGPQYKGRTYFEEAIRNAVTTGAPMFGAIAQAHGVSSICVCRAIRTVVQYAYRKAPEFCEEILSYNPLERTATPTEFLNAASLWLRTWKATRRWDWKSAWAYQIDWNKRI